MTTPEWRTSSHSQEAGACVAIHHTLTKVQDTKHPGIAITGDVRSLTRWLNTASRQAHVPSNQPG